MVELQEHDLEMYWWTPESGDAEVPGVGKDFRESLRKRAGQGWAGRLRALVVAG